MTTTESNLHKPTDMRIFEIHSNKNHNNKLNTVSRKNHKKFNHSLTHLNGGERNENDVDHELGIWFEIIIRFFLLIYTYLLLFKVVQTCITLFQVQRESFIQIILSY